MNGKMIIKLTLNEATDPDLYAYLARFDNVRLRAGALKASAGAAVRGDRLHQDLRPTTAATSMQPIEPSLGHQTEAAHPVEVRSPVRASVSPAPAIASTREPVHSAAFSQNPETGTSERQWETDLIGEQFANF